MLGKVIDRYKILEKVGEGGMAVVYKAVHISLGRVVALKVLHPALLSIERNRIRFEREAKAIEKLRHPNIPEIYDYSGSDSEVAYISTEFIDGETLRQILHRVKFIPSELAAFITFEILSALEYAHQMGIIHRDIKPENVMVARDGSVKLMDFGIARIMDERSVTMTGAIIGSPAYMSPEQAGKGNIGFHSDIFSTGSLLYHISTGHIPFQGENPSVILKNIIEGNYLPPMDVLPSMSHRLSNIICKALSGSIESRYRNASEMKKDVEEVLESCGFKGEEGRAELKEFLLDPDRWEEKEKLRLIPRLISEGKRLIRERRDSEALKIFNRVLFLDEGNQEVLRQINSIHRGRRKIGAIAGLFGLIIFITLSVFLLDRLNRTHPQQPPNSNAGGSEERVGKPVDPVVGEAEDQIEPEETGQKSSVETEEVAESDRKRGLESEGVNGRDKKERTKEEREIGPSRRKEKSKETGVAGEKRMGILNIQTWPPAELFINGKKHSLAMDIRPNYLLSLEEGEYIIELKNPYCLPIKEKVLIREGIPVEKSYSPQTLPAKIFLIGFPEGTEVMERNLKMCTIPSCPDPLIIDKPRDKGAWKISFKLPEKDGRILTKEFERLEYGGEYRVDFKELQSLR